MSTVEMQDGEFKDLGGQIRRGPGWCCRRGW